MNIYQDTILDHYHNPRCKGHLDVPTHTAGSLNASCGDKLQVDILVEGDIIKEARFEGAGCAISQASASLLLESLQGQSVQAARALSKNDLLALLGVELSPARLKCALLSLETVQKSLIKPYEI